MYTCKYARRRLVAACKQKFSFLIKRASVYRMLDTWAIAFNYRSKELNLILAKKFFKLKLNFT